MTLLRRAWLRKPILPRPARVALAFLTAAGALLLTGQTDAQQPPTPPRIDDPVAGDEATLFEYGRRLFDQGCADCHGEDARGIPGRGPSLREAGELTADFYLRTGRMPLDDPEDQPRRAESPYTKRQIAALVAYVGSFGGPKVPEVHPERGDIADGLQLFGEYCMGCHQVVGRGGIMTRGVAPDLQVSEPIDVAEAIEIGPYLMPEFAGQFDQREIDSLARYVEYTEDPEDVGGWGIGHIGPIPEGIVAWLLAGFSLLLVIRLIGERTTE